MALKPTSKIKLELLAPAKNADIAIEAVKHGADAVYIGAVAYGARSSAGNSIEDIQRAVDYAHKFNARIYVTVNTIIFEDELKSVENMIHELYRIGVDAIIVQDMGILRMNLPPISLHASTQCDLRTSEKAQFLEKVGFSQLVMARELTLSEIKAIRNKVNVPLEAFVHGALCVSYSGRCGVSYACTGRSANRGECAQFCRLPYNLEDEKGNVIVSNKHLLSLKDLNQSKHLLEMIEAGVSSFKIEGRLKDVDYVKNIVAYYNRELNKIVEKYPDLYERSSSGHSIVTFTSKPDKVFNRTFTNYFLLNRRLNSGVKIASIDTPKSQGEYIGKVVSVKNGISIKISTQKALSNGDGLSYFNSKGEYVGFRINKVIGNVINLLQPVKIDVGTELFRTYDKEFDALLNKESAERKILVDMQLRYANNLLILDVTDERGNTTTVTQILESALELAKSEQSSRQVETLGKLGGTIYQAKEIHVLGDYFIPNSILSELKRRAIEKLDSAQRISYKFEYRKPEDMTAKFYTEKLIYADNVSNSLSRNFYTEHGVRIIDSAIECKGGKLSGNEVLMHTRYCVLRELGYCRKDKNAPKLPQELYLVNEGVKLLVATNCADCEMLIYKG